MSDEPRTEHRPVREIALAAQAQRMAVAVGLVKQRTEAELEAILTLVSSRERPSGAEWLHLRLWGILGLSEAILRSDRSDVT